MGKFKNESVLVNEANDIVLRYGEMAKITTSKGTTIQGLVRFIGDGSVSFEDKLSIHFNEIEKVEIIRE